MKRILKIFPHGVIIETEAEQENQRIAFTNEQFQKQIQNIRNRVEELERIDVNFDLEDSFSGTSFMTLQQYLARQQSLLASDRILEQPRVTIKCRADAAPGQLLLDSEDEDGAEAVEKIFNVKSMQVEWQGRPSFMHVFIDNTDIVRLEEATNNIKCQKIMFASVSHEFRTPLNAIMNSFKFIADSFRKLQESLLVKNSSKLLISNEENKKTDIFVNKQQITQQRLNSNSVEIL